MRLTSWGSIAIVIVLIAGGAACSSGRSASDADVDEDGGGASSGDAKPNADGCCPPSSALAGSMYLGGAAHDGTCHRTHDFWCSQNWRIEKDAQGCDQWRYDVRAPREDETGSCQPKPRPVTDAGGD